MRRSVIATLAVAACGWAAAPAQATFPGQNGRIVFVREAGRQLDLLTIGPEGTGERQSDISIIGADGRGERRLTWSDALERNPVWSPDGRYIAFASDMRAEGARGGTDFELYTLTVDGTVLTQLTRNDVADMSPDWQPLP